MMSTTYPPGTAPVKAQSVLCLLSRFFSTASDVFFLHPRYVISWQDQTPPDDDAAEGNTSHVSLGLSREVDDDGQNVPTQGDKSQTSGAQRRKLAREEKKKRRGQNKGRRFQKMRDELDLCWKVAAGETCEFGTQCVQSSWSCFHIFQLEETLDADSHTMSRGTFLPNLGMSNSRFPPTFPTNLPL